MRARKELCRNFQRGSCQFGDRCKFIHTTQQQPKPNAFGFAASNVANHQQKPNPFGFGVQNNSQPRGSTPFGNNQNQFKAFENKWTRQPENQPQSADHKCTDPGSCKRIIEEDFKNEKPLWKLTCYAHQKYGPCDITGDISYEELRATAYDDAKRGLNLQSIIERERNLLNSKLVESESLLRNPYKSSAAGLPNQSIVSGTPGVFPHMAQNSAAPTFPGFGQQNDGFGARPSAPQNNMFGQPNSFSSFSQNSNAFGMSSSPSLTAGFPGVQVQGPMSASPFPSSTAGFGSSNVINSQSSLLSAPVSSSLNPSSSSSLTSLNMSNPSSDAAGKESTNVQLGVNPQKQNASGVASIWLKEKWSPGEIPEEAPPEGVV